jgi:phage terminase small subunit
MPTAGVMSSGRARMTTARQQRFVEEYLVDLNATQAAIRAGYSARTAGQFASRLLKDVKIAAAIAELRAKRSEKVEANEAWILARLTENANRAMMAVPVLNDEGKETGVYRYEGTVANRALELLGKHRGMFIERREIAGVNGAPVTVRLVWEGKPK